MSSHAQPQRGLDYFGGERRSCNFQLPPLRSEMQINVSTPSVKEKEIVTQTHCSGILLSSFTVISALSFSSLPTVIQSQFDE